MRAYKVSFGHLGNGITVWDSNSEVNGDYEKLAHIDKFRVVKYYVEVPARVKRVIENFARVSDPEISYTQEEKVFVTRPECS